MELKKFKMVTARDNTLWRGEELPKGVAKMVFAAETEDDVRWFFGKLDWSAWIIVPLDESPVEEDKPRRGRPPKDAPELVTV